MKTAPNRASLDRELAGYLSDQRKDHSDRLDRSLAREERLERDKLKKADLAQALNAVGNGLKIASSVKSAYNSGEPFGRTQYARPRPPLPKLERKDRPFVGRLEDLLESKSLMGTLERESLKGTPKLFKEVSSAIRKELKFDGEVARESQRVDRALSKNSGEHLRDAQQQLRKRIQHNLGRGSFA